MPALWQHNFPSSSSSCTRGIWVGVAVAGVGIFITWIHRSMRPPPPKICGSLNGPPVTALRVRLKDGRHIAYKEHGVPRHLAHYKVIYVHGFNGSRNSAILLPKATFDEHSLYVVSFDRAGYGESDPNPLRCIKSEAEDVEQLADLLELGSTFYLLSDSIGAHVSWSCLKYIPHRLAGVGMVVPVVNYWWRCIDRETFNQAFGTQILRDRLFMRVVRHFPWLIYFYITQFWIPKPTPLVLNFHVLNTMDRQVLIHLSQTITQERLAELHVGTQQGVAESLCRDLKAVFGDWDFDPSEIENPFVDRPGEVHIWQGEEDYLVPKEAQLALCKKLPWVNYHEVKRGGHLLMLQPGFMESVLRTLLLGAVFDFQLPQ